MLESAAACIRLACLGPSRREQARLRVQLHRSSRRSACVLRPRPVGRMDGRGWVGGWGGGGGGHRLKRTAVLCHATLSGWRTMNLLRQFLNGAGAVTLRFENQPCSTAPPSIAATAGSALFHRPCRTIAPSILSRTNESCAAPTISRPACVLHASMRAGNKPGTH